MQNKTFDLKLSSEETTSINLLLLARHENLIVAIEDYLFDKDMFYTIDMLDVIRGDDGDVGLFRMKKKLLHNYLVLLRNELKFHCGILN